MNEREDDNDYLLVNQRLLDTIGCLIDAHFTSHASNIDAMFEFSQLSEDEAEIEFDPITNENAHFAAIAAKLLDDCSREIKLNEQYAKLLLMHGKGDAAILINQHDSDQLHMARYKQITCDNTVTNAVSSLKLVELYSKEGERYAHRCIVCKREDKVTETTTLTYLNERPCFAERTVIASEDERTIASLEEIQATQEASDFAAMIGIDERPSHRELSKIIDDLDNL